jgi:hypothetical protein
MTRQDREEKKKDEQHKQPQQGEQHERKVAPPIEREHETRQGIEEEEQHKPGRDRR